MLYESWIHPITITSILPSAGLGALLALMLVGMPLDVIGIINLLLGIVKKNGIMLVDVIADARVRQADAQAQIAGTPLLSSVGLQSQGGPQRLLNNTGQERHYLDRQATFKASYEPDFWGKTQAALEAAGVTANASRYQQEVVWLTTSQAIANTYVSCLSLQDR